MKIACDMDGVVSNFVRGMNKYLFDSRGLAVDDSWITTWNWEESPLVKANCPALTSEVWSEAFYEYCERRLFLTQDLIESGVALVIDLLRAGHEVKFFSVRPPHCVPPTLFDIEVVSCPDDLEKAKLALAWGADCLVDDRTQNCVTAWNSGLPAYLWVQPWNRDGADFRINCGGRGEEVLDAQDLLNYLAPRETSVGGNSSYNTPPAKALRYNDGKLDFTRIPFDVLVEFAKVYQRGSIKYPDDPVTGQANWLKGCEYSVNIKSLMRHFVAWSMGQDRDPETGLHHLAQVMWCAAANLTYQLRDLGTDDRTKLPIDFTISQPKGK